MRANCLEAFANLGSSGWVLLASGFPGLWPRLPSHIWLFLQYSLRLRRPPCRCSPKSSFFKDHPVMINPSTYSEDAWKQWHSTRVDRLSASEGGSPWSVSTFANGVRPNTLLWGTGCRSVARGFPAKRMGQFVLGQEAGVFTPSMKHAPSMARRLMRACCRPMLMADRPVARRGGLLVLIERGGRGGLALVTPKPKAAPVLGHSCWSWQQSAVVTGTFVSSSQAARSKRRMHWGRWRRPPGRHDSICLAQSTSGTDATKQRCMS